MVLPLGTLVAQRLANPQWFGTAASSTSDSHNSTLSRTGMPMPGGGPVPATTAPTAKHLNNNHRTAFNRPGPPHTAALSTLITSASDGSVTSEKGKATHVDNESAAAAQASGADLERGEGVRVGYGIERSEERLAAARDS